MMSRRPRSPYGGEMDVIRQPMRWVQDHPRVADWLLVAIAAAATLVAAWLPARRAGKLNVLDAISH